MQIFKEKPKWRLTKRPEKKVEDKIVLDKKTVKIDSSKDVIIAKIKKDNKTLSGAKVYLGHSERTIKKGDQKLSIGTKAKQTFSKFAAYAGLISIVNSTGNACKGISSNPFLLALGVGLIAVSIGALLWSWFG